MSTSALQKATRSASSLAFASVSFFIAFSAFVFVCCTELSSIVVQIVLGMKMVKMLQGRDLHAMEVFKVAGDDGDRQREDKHPWSSY